MPDASQIYWTAGFLNERFPAPISPLGWSVVGPLFEEYALRDPLRFMGYPEAERIPATRLVHGHPYANVLIFQILYNPFPDAFLPADAVRYFPEGAVHGRRTAPYPHSILNPRFLLSILAHYARDPINWSPFNFWHWERYTRRHDQRVAELNARLDHAAEPRDILAVTVSANQAHSDLLKIHRWSLTYADLFFSLLARFAGDSAQTLIADVSNLTQQVDHDLQAVSHLAADMGLRLDTDDALSEALANPEFAGAVGQFLAAHGHRSFSLDISEPTYRDEPLLFLRLLQFPVEPPRAEPGDHSQVNVTRSRMPVYKRIIFDLLLAFARRYASLREDQRYYWHKSLAVTRRAYLMLGLQLREENSIASANEIFFATADEVAEYVDGQLSAQQLALAIQSRRQAWENYQREYTKSPSLAYPPFLLGDTPLNLESPSLGELWQGRGVSPGQAHGKVRVILDARDLPRVATGEILVAPATDPGWTPVFARLTALVVERGGVLAHSAIVAREHKLPAVAGISNITRELADGDWIEVDGTHGLVRRIKV
jgi:phosphohistidine swiveling domain-containing protein